MNPRSIYDCFETPSSASQMQLLFESIKIICHPPGWRFSVAVSQHRPSVTSAGLHHSDLAIYTVTLVLSAWLNAIIATAVPKTRSTRHVVASIIADSQVTQGVGVVSP